MSRLPEHTCYTMIPNFIFDVCLGSLGEGELKILMMIYRQTVGFDKKADKISYSQFTTKTGLSRSTISQSIKGLIKKGLVKANRSGIINEYTYCLPESNYQTSSKSEPGAVRNSNQQPVRNPNTQKKALKETERNTTSSTNLSVDFLEVTSYWNEVFPKTLDGSDPKLVKQIEKALNEFTVEELKEAIFRRSVCNYYQEKKPQLLDKPSAFFPYPETIANDLERTPFGIYTFDEMIDKVTSSNLTTDDYVKVTNIKDKKGLPMWRPKNNPSIKY